MIKINKVIILKNIKILEKIWSQKKYFVLAKSHKIYLEIRNLLKEKENPNYEKFYELLNLAKNLPFSNKDFLNASLHIWGYFKKSSNINEMKHFFELVEDFKMEEINYKEIICYLKKLLNKYPNEYLSSSEYFKL